MKVFVLEDNPFKLNQIITFLKTSFPNIEINYSTFLNGGKVELSLCKYDFAILDNQLPRFRDDFRMETDSINEILEWMYLEEIDTKCIGLSSERITLSEDYPNYLGSVKYEFNSCDWENSIKNIMLQYDRIN